MHRCIASESADESLVVLSVVIVQCESTFSVQFHLFHYVSVCFSIADLSRFHTWYLERRRQMHRCIASESADESLVVLSVVIVQCESTFSVQFHLFHYVSVCFSIADLSRFHTWTAVSVD